jgi:flavin prenyltransferase
MVQKKDKKEVKKIIVGISGASGAVYGIEILKLLRDVEGVETHLIISKAAAMTIAYETGYKVSDVIKLADAHYAVDDIGAALSSGSYKTMGMVIAPCSAKTMAEIASGVTANLMSRAADVVLKEKRRLVLMLRETPLHLGHIKNLEKLCQMGAIISPPVPAFYTKPKSLEEMVRHTVGRVLDLFDIETMGIKRWQGMRK